MGSISHHITPLVTTSLSVGHTHIIYIHIMKEINFWKVIVKSHYEEVIVAITRVRGRAEDECNNNDNLQVQWDLTGFYPIF